MAIAPNGRTLYVSSAVDSTIGAFEIGSDGRLTPLGSVPSGAPAPAKGVAVTPDGRFVYVSHGRPTDVADTQLTGFALNFDGSHGAQVAAVNNGRAAFDTMITPDGRFLYVVFAGAGSVFGYRIDADGSLSAASCPTRRKGPRQCHYGVRRRRRSRRRGGGGAYRGI
jgi:6-phosphogluconolactonase (cycloisomerase 2 family)